MYGPLSYFLPLCTTIRPKVRVLINLFLLFEHDHLTKIWGHSYSLIHSFLNCTNISYTIFMAVLPLYFVRYIHVSTALIFRTLYPWLYEVYAREEKRTGWLVATLLQLQNDVWNTSKKFRTFNYNIQNKNIQNTNFWLSNILLLT